jgi:hypothetical protein
MDYIDAHRFCGLILPEEIDIFDELHARLSRLDKSSVYDLLAIMSTAIPATALAFKAKAFISRCTGADEEDEKAVGNAVFTLFSDTQKDRRKSDYDLYCACLGINAIFAEINDKMRKDGADAFRAQSVCAHFIGKLTDKLSAYVDKPAGADVFARFCEYSGIEQAYNSEKESRSDGGTALREIVREINAKTAELANIHSACKRALASAASRKDSLQSECRVLGEIKAQARSCFDDCSNLLKKLKRNDSEQNYIDAYKCSLQKAISETDEVTSGYSVIFAATDTDAKTAEESLAFLQGLSENTTRLCERINADNKISNLIDIDAGSALREVERLLVQAGKYTVEVECKTRAINTVVDKYDCMLQEIKKDVESAQKGIAESRDRINRRGVRVYASVSEDEYRRQITGLLG